MARDNGHKRVPVPPHKMIGKSVLIGRCFALRLANPRIQQSFEADIVPIESISTREIATILYRQQFITQFTEKVHTVGSNPISCCNIRLVSNTGYSAFPERRDTSESP